jgi:hypothetical protein
MYPSTREMVAIALPMPLYIAAGVGLTTCIRVYDACQHPATSMSLHLQMHTLSKSMGYMTECSCPSISLMSPHLFVGCAGLQRSLRRRLRPYSPPARSSVGGIHSYTRTHQLQLHSSCLPNTASRTRILLAQPVIWFCRCAARPFPAPAGPESNRPLVASET